MPFPTDQSPLSGFTGLERSAEENSFTLLLYTNPILLIDLGLTNTCLPVSG